MTLITNSKNFDVESLIKELTLEEKVKLISGVDFWHTAKIERLGIPKIRVSDGPNGIRGTKFFNGVPAGCFPCGTGLAATFNKDLLFEAGQLMGEEAKAKAVHVILGPTCNIQRSPLGGRGFESYSPDPVLSGFASAAIISGIQDKKIAATLKHFVCNDIETERSSINSIVTQRALREVYLLPFQIAIRDSNPISLMTSYNKVNGEHVSNSKYLIEEILRDEWKWQGATMSDWYGLYSLKESIDAGLDLEMPGPPKMRKYDSVQHAVNSKEIHLKILNKRVENVLKLIKYSLNSGINENDPETSSNNTPITSLKLREIASESIVLLKNDNNLLPLKPADKIAIFGPNAKFASYCGGGSASLLSYYSTTPYDGIKSKADIIPEYTLGAAAHKMLPGLGTQLKRDDGSVGFTMKIYLKPRDYQGDRNFVEQLNLNSSYMHMVDYYNSKILENDLIFYADIEGYFTPEEDGEYEFGVAVVGTALIFVDETLVVDNKTKQIFGNTFFNQGSIEEKGRIVLSKDKTYKIRIEFSSGKTSILTKGLDPGNYGGGGIRIGAIKVFDPLAEIAKAVEIAKKNDKVIIVSGTNLEFETESLDREDMKLPGYQDQLIEAIVAANKNTIVVNQSGTPVEMPWIEKIPAVLQAWFAGNEGGNAIADVLYGDVNPSGKLSITFPIRLQDNPTYFNFNSNNGQVLYGEDVYVDYRFYEKIDRPVLFPFGHGLSYSNFTYDNLVLSINESSDLLIAKFELKNNSDRSGKEVAQLYVSQQKPSITRPIKELKNFIKVSLKAGETKKIEIKTSLKYATSFFDEYYNDWCSESGTYNVIIGKSTENIQLVESFQLKETKHWSGL
ncbi:hypothetical protein PACTADRAFT_49721 [Pachysolen tannophilus NRRL Y-2460]|uniref:beta-glucosidase n=1 Tax=Pachysolen tannophilus NRRL Y-2460 TaxID=669874 RepID=A0A1E4TXA8_PACTA|nr:hypothetical protein PACTADRAFT_49721 [Pachysolen tannophilus NRRL Y-2460]